MPTLLLDRRRAERTAHLESIGLRSIDGAAGLKRPASPEAGYTQN